MDITPVAEEADFDNLLSSLGFGKWQFVILLSPFFAMSVFPVHLLGASFLNAPVPFRCSSGEILICEGDLNCWNRTHYYLGNSSYYDNRCLATSVNESVLQEIATLPLLHNQRFTNLESCPLIEYDTSVFSSTIVSEFDLICDRTYFRPIFVTVGSIGNMMGSILGGYVGDKWGRLWAVKICSFVNVLIPIAMAFSPYYPLLLVTRFIAGLSIAATLVPAWSLGIESTPSKHRNLVGMLLGIPFSGFLIAFAGTAYLIRKWNYLLLAGASPAILQLFVAFLATESPPWLLQKGKLDEAIKVLTTAKTWNNAKLSSSIPSIVEKLDLKQKLHTANYDLPRDGKASLTEKLKRALRYMTFPAMRTIILVMGIIWICHYVLYIGVALNANNFASDDPFLYVALTGVMDLVAILLITPLTSCFGRKVFLITSYIGGGLLFFLELAVPSGTSFVWIRWVIVMTGFFLIAGSLQVNFLYSPEVFPTEIRARGFAFVQLLGNIGSSVAPFITDVLPQYTWWATGVTFGCAGLIGGVLVPLLPETRNQSLPETIQDVEDRAKKPKEKKKKHIEGLDKSFS